jgi:hypothetical protein
MQKDDPVIVGICLNIKRKVKEEKKEELDIDTVYEISKSIYSLIPYAIQNNLSLRLDKLGKFCPIPKKDKSNQ